MSWWHLFQWKHDWRLMAYLIQVRCAQTEVRLCFAQLSCVCLWTNWKKTTNKERRMCSTHVRTTISHVQMFRKVLRCVIPTSVAHLANIKRQPDHFCVKRFSKSVLLVFSDCSFVFTMWVVSVWSNVDEFSITIHHFSLVILVILFVLRRNWIRPDLIHCELSFVLVHMSVKLCCTFAWNLSNWSYVTCKSVSVVRYSQSLPSSMSWSWEICNFSSGK